MPRALITGITGQDGSFLAEQLLQQGWEVFGLVRRSSSKHYWRIQHLLEQIQLVHGDMLDLSSLIRMVQHVDPDHVYNLAAQSSVALSWSEPLHTAEVTALGCARMLEAIRIGRPQARFYQASSSEIFGLNSSPMQSEGTALHPRSPYGVAKAYAHHLTINYRESYGLFCVAGILFNHESERRGMEFVTRKIAAGAARIKRGKDVRPIPLGNTSARRDWGFAGDYTQAMLRMLSADTPQDYVIATGQSWSVADFAERAFNYVGLDWQNHVELDSTLCRPAEVPTLCGDATKAKVELGWKPLVEFDQLVHRMVDWELRRQAV